MNKSLFMKWLVALVFSLAYFNFAMAEPLPPFELATEPESPPISLAEKNLEQLQNALPTYENAAAHPWATITTDEKLKRGMKDVAVLALRGHLKTTGDLKPEDDTGLALYDSKVMKAVKHFQERHGLSPDGVVGPATLYELNIPAEERLQQIQINISRWAKLASDLKDRYIMVNVPDYHLDLIDNGVKVLSMKAVVGKPERPTPELISTVTRMVLNPYWNVPKLIAQEDIVPKVVNNPDYLNDMHIRIFDRQDDDAIEISPQDIDWYTAEIDGFQYHLRQDPGNDNALGLVKFEFPNTSDVYMHDTPAKNLFDQDKRAYSSGCIRLERPFDLASYLMQDDPEWSNDIILQILDTHKTKYIKVSKPTQIVITYLTTWVDDDGNLQFRDDIYGLDGIGNSIY